MSQIQPLHCEQCGVWWKPGEAMKCEHAGCNAVVCPNCASEVQYALEACRKHAADVAHDVVSERKRLRFLLEDLARIFNERLDLVEAQTAAEQGRAPSAFDIECMAEAEAA